MRFAGHVLGCLAVIAGFVLSGPPARADELADGDLGPGEERLDPQFENLGQQQQKDEQDDDDDDQDHIPKSPAAR